MTLIHTERLVMRPAQTTDLDAIHAILSDHQATAYWSTPPHDNLAETQAWLGSMIDSALPIGEDFIVEYQGQVIGKAGFYRFPEIGFIFHPAFWRLGLASEAVTAVVARAFTVHNLAAVTADVDPRNTASLRLLTRLGFYQTGTARNTWLIGDKWCDSVYLELDQPTFDARTLKTT